MIGDSNFRCECGKTHHIPVYKIVVRGEETVYLDSITRKPLSCGCGKAKLIPITTSEVWGGNLGTFNMLSLTDKQKHLSARSKKHSKQFNNPNDIKGNQI